jgi:hypothetical protein
VIATIPNVDDEYDLPVLSEHMVALKREYSEISAASVLLEPQVPYDYLIQVMDAVRSVEVEVGGGEGPEFMQAALFPDISVGEAP